MTEFTPIPALVGGSLIGLSAVLLMAFLGRIAGMTGILTGVLPPLAKDWGWRAAFLAGAIVAPILVPLISGFEISYASPMPLAMVLLGGLIAGVGVFFASGCTSGHGVCGIARLSTRSIVATMTFMVTAVATVFVIRHVIGGF